MQKCVSKWSVICDKLYHTQQDMLQLVEVSEHVIEIEEFAVAEGVDGGGVTAVLLEEAFALEEESRFLVGRSGPAAEAGNEDASEFRGGAARGRGR